MIQSPVSISGHTKPFAVLGYPIGHTLSPVMHNAAFEALEWDAVYLAFSVNPDDLLGVLESMRAMGFQGVNLTIPLKEVAFHGLERLDDSARLLGAVNTVQFAPDGLIGHNTDGEGFLRAHEEAFGKSVAGDAVFVLGAGGAGRALALMCAREGARALHLADLDMERAEKTAEETRQHFPGVEVTAVSRDGQVEAARASDLVIQATPVGMKPEDPSPLPAEAFSANSRVFDLIYMYPETSVMKEAAKAGAAVANGLGMLLHQGAKAFTIWTGTEPPVDRMRAALERAVYPS